MLEINLEEHNESMPTEEAWLKRIEDLIDHQKESLQQPIHPFKIDAIGNKSHPSIFKLGGEPNKVTVANVGPYRLSCHSREHSNQPDEIKLPIISDSTKWGIVYFLAHWFDLDTRQFLEWALKEDNNKKARACYVPETFNMNVMEFAEMLLQDGCLLLFAIFILRSSVHVDKGPANLSRSGSLNSHIDDRDSNSGDRKNIREAFIFLSADMMLHMSELRLDLLMLDNQIPFFVLEKLHVMTSNTLFKDTKKHSIKEMALSCFDELHPQPGRRRPRGDKFPETVHHLLHLFHWSRVPPKKYTIDNSSFLPKDPKFHLPSASDLRESATIFEKRTSSSPLDLSFSSRIRFIRVYGVMRIPVLCLYDYSETIFRNLIAFEQKHIKCGHGVTAYCIYMSRLLQTEADAKLLRSKRILAQTPVADKEIVDLFSKLGNEYKGTLIPKDLRKFYEDVSRHHESRLSRFTGEIMLQYFPTRPISFVVICGFLITAATVAYSIHNVYRVYHPFKH